MADLIETIRDIHTELLFCSNTIRHGWGSAEGEELRNYINKIIRKLIALQRDKKLAEPSRDLVASITIIRKNMLEGKYKTGEEFLNMLKSILILGFKNMVESLQVKEDYRQEIKDQIGKVERMRVA